MTHHIHIHLGRRAVDARQTADVFPSDFMSDVEKLYQESRRIFQLEERIRGEMRRAPKHPVDPKGSLSPEFKALEKKYVRYRAQVTDMHRWIVKALTAAGHIE